MTVRFLKSELRKLSRLSLPERVKVGVFGFYRIILLKCHFLRSRYYPIAASSPFILTYTYIELSNHANIYHTMPRHSKVSASRQRTLIEIPRHDPGPLKDRYGLTDKTKIYHCPYIQLIIKVINNFLFIWAYFNFTSTCIATKT